MLANRSPQHHHATTDCVVEPQFDVFGLAIASRITDPSFVEQRPTDIA